MTLVGCTAQRQCPAFAASVYNGGDPCPREENQISLNSIFPHLLWDPYSAKTGCYLPQKICSLPTRNKTQHEVTSSMGWSSVSREAQNKIFTFRGEVLLQEQMARPSFPHFFLADGGLCNSH